MKFYNKLDHLLLGDKQNHLVVKFDETKYVEFINGKLICHDGDQTLEVEYFDPTGLNEEQIFARVDLAVNRKLKQLGKDYE